MWFWPQPRTSLTPNDSMDLPLKQIPNLSWTARFESLMRSPFLAKKYDRAKRIAENAKYIDDYLPELRAAKPDVIVSRVEPGFVIDIGPGPGEFLEIARALGHIVLGIDAAVGEGGMGDDYLDLSRLMTDRQEIAVEYIGFQKWLSEDRQILDGECNFINCRGSIEQAFADCMTGPPHDEHQCCRKLRWKEDHLTATRFIRMFQRFRTMLRSGGIVLIHANGSADDTWYDTTIQRAARSAGFELVKRWDERLHKWRKP